MFDLITSNLGVTYAMSGVFLLLVESFLVTGVLVWIGLGLISMGIALLWNPGLSPVWQIAIGCVVSLCAMFVTKVYLSKVVKESDETVYGDPNSLVSNAPIFRAESVSEDGRFGRAKSSMPFMGSREWAFKSNAPVTQGDSLKVVSIEGNIIRVKKKEENKL